MQCGIGHGGHNGIGIGITVTTDIDGFHGDPPFVVGSG